MFRDDLLSQEVPTLSSSTSSSSITSPPGFDPTNFQTTINNFGQRQNSNLTIKIDPGNPDYVLLEEHKKTRISSADISRLLAAIGINSRDEIPQLKQTIASQQEEIDLLKVKLQQYENNVADHLRQIYVRLGNFAPASSSSYPENHFTQDTTDFNSGSLTTSPYFTSTIAHPSDPSNLPTFNLTQLDPASYPHAIAPSSPSRFFSALNPAPSAKTKKRKRSSAAGASTATKSPKP
jgi:hypothetical protein